MLMWLLLFYLSFLTKQQSWELPGEGCPGNPIPLHGVLLDPSDRYAERYGNFTLTARDMEILGTVYRYRYLEARHIRALVGEWHAENVFR
jgi:hypothetical protein